MTTTETLEINWAAVIADEKATAEETEEKRTTIRLAQQKETEARNALRNSLIKQSLSGVQGVLADVLKEKEVREFLDTNFYKVQASFVPLFEGQSTNEDVKTAMICLVRTTCLGFTVEIRGCGKGALTRGWTVHSDSFYTLSDDFLPKLGELVNSELLVRHIVRALYRYL